MSDQKLKKAALKYHLSFDLLQKNYAIFQKYCIPVFLRKRTPKHANRIVMVSTHGYWGDPPPAGVPDTGGQTYYVLEVSKTWASQGRKVIILARWFKPYPLVESFAKNLWLVRIPAGNDEFIRKEEIYPFVPELAEQAVAVSALFGAHAVMGHYADGMAIALEIGERLQIPTVATPHSLGINKVISLGYDPYDPETWFDKKYNFGTRENFEIAALKGADFEIANTSQEPAILKKYYEYEFPHLVMPAGAGKIFFNAHKKPQKNLLNKYNLTPQKYFIYFGRFSEAKNIPGVVKVFGEAGRLAPRLMKGFKLVLVGGSQKNPPLEEINIKKSITALMKNYGLSENEVIRLPSQSWKNLAVLAHHCFFYIGMQKMEPFGMGVAEAMAAHAPVMISKAAGITRWIKNEKEAIVVDPNDPLKVAQKLISILNQKMQLKQLASNGYRLAKSQFSWPGIGRKQGEILDLLCQGKSPHKTMKSIFRRRVHRSYHRALPVWRGDQPFIKSNHKKAAEGLLPCILEEVKKARHGNERVIAAIGGESGAGKTAIAEYLRYLLRKQKIWGTTIAGDAFFKLTPAENYKARFKAYTENKLPKHLGASEINLKQLDLILNSAAKRETKEILIPSDCRRLDSKRYKNVPVDLSRTDIILVDLTYSLLLKNASLKIFLESDYKNRTDELKEKNINRDPDQDFQFILKILAIEHNIIQKLKNEANFVLTKNYKVIRVPG